MKKIDWLDHTRKPVRNPESGGPRNESFVRKSGKVP